MNRVGWNVVSGFAGSLWATVISIACIPFYIRLIGAEGYGLVGIFTMIQGISFLLDAGLSTTINRELAKLSSTGAPAHEVRDLVRTIAVVYWAVGLAIGTLVVCTAPWVSTHWVQAEGLSPPVVKSAIRLMGLSLAVQWPSSLYTGALYGLQRQVLLNSMLVGLNTLRSVGAVLVLQTIAPTTGVFFRWQIAVSVLQTGLLCILLWRVLPKSDLPARFRLAHLRRVSRFAAGMSGITVLSLLLTQADKVLLSRLLPLREFGFYTVAVTVASGLTRLCNPIGTAFFPRFSEIVARGDLSALQATYHRSCQLLAVLVLPAAVVLAVFAPEVLWLWTRDRELVTQTHLIVTLLVVGTALNSLMTLPYTAQLAYGWTRLTFLSNLVALAVLVPVLFLSVHLWGAVGGAAGWFVINLGYVLLNLPVMHNRILQGELERWYLYDVGLPLAAAIAVASCGRLVLNNYPGTGAIWIIAATSAGALIASGMAVDWLRQVAVRTMRNMAVLVVR